MRSIPDAFFGAILGAWVASVNHLMQAPPLKIVAFIGAIIGISISLGIFSSGFPTYLRVSALIVAAWLAAFAVIAFSFDTYLMIFADGESTFFVVLVFGWFIVAFLSATLERRLLQREPNSLKRVH